MESIFAGLVRHALTAVGGGLITQGVVTSGDVEIISGAIIAIGGVVWSAISKWRANKKTAAK